jgi:hypothetical protein
MPCAERQRGAHPWYMLAHPFSYSSHKHDSTASPLHKPHHSPFVCVTDQPMFILVNETYEGKRKKKKRKRQKRKKGKRKKEKEKTKKIKNKE